MVFVIISLALFLGVAFFQSLQGTFSAIIMMVLTILSAVVAANFYAPISQSLLFAYIPEYADACSLAGVFLITLVVFRTLADNLIRGNIVTYGLPDRILAGIISIPTALVLVGMASIAIEMLPFHDQLLLHKRFNPTVERLNKGGLFPYADDFASWTLEKLSTGSLRGEEAFGKAHPDWAAETSAQRIAPQRETRHAVEPSGLNVPAAWKKDTPLLVKEYSLNQTPSVKEQRSAQSGYYYLVLKLELPAQFADSDGTHRFGWGQVRLVGFRGNDRNRPMNFYAIGVSDPDFPGDYNYMRVKVQTPPHPDDDTNTPRERNYGYFSRSAGALSVEVAFEVPEDFVPWFAEYKRWARSSIPKVSDKNPASAAPSPTDQPEKDSVGEVIKSGWHAEFKPDPQRTKFTNQLPFTLMSGSAGGEAELEGTLFEKGYVSGTIGGQGGLDSGSGSTITEFKVPSDKRLLRLECIFSPAESQFLQKIFASVQNVVQKKAIDNRGNTFLPVGQYVMLGEQGSVQEAELTYDPEAETHGRVEAFRKVKFNQVQGKPGRVGFLFLIPPGTRMEKFEIGGGPIEVQSLQLTAPN